MLKNWETPSPSGTQNGKKAIISPCLLAPGLAGSAADFYTGLGKTGSQNWETPSPSGTQNGKKTIISPCLLGSGLDGSAADFCTGRGKKVAT